MKSDKGQILGKKTEIRKEITGLLRDQSPELREERSGIIQNKLLSDGEFETSNTVMVYVSLPTEVSTYLIINTALELGKRVVVPYVNEISQTMISVEIASTEDLVVGPYGIYQPKENLKTREISLKEIDLVIVPAIAFDKDNMRLGRGKGYYDKFLSSGELSSVRSIGLAFQFQILDEVPCDPHDRPVTKVITN